MDENSGHWPSGKRNAIIHSQVAEWMRLLRPTTGSDLFSVSDIRHKATHSEVILRSTGGPDAGERFFLVIPFFGASGEEGRIAPSKAFRFDEKSRQWQRLAIPKMETEARDKPLGRPLPASSQGALFLWMEKWTLIIWLLAGVLIVFGIIAIFSPLRDTVKGLQSLGWPEAKLINETRGWSYVSPVDGQKIETGHPQYTVATVDREQEGYHALFEKAQAWWAFQHHKPTVVYVNPSNPRKSVLVNGIPPQSTGLLLIKSIFLALGLRLLIGLRRGRLEWTSYLFILMAHLLLFGFYAAAAWLWSLFIFVPMPGWPALIFLAVLLIFDLVPGLWTWAISHEGFVWFLQQVIILALLPVGVGTLGLGLPFVVAIVTAVLALVVLFSVFRPSAIPQNLVRLVWMPFYVAGILAVFRSLCLFVYMLLPGVPYHLPKEYLGDITMVARFDLGVGAAGILVALITTFLDTFWRFRQAAQVTNLPTSMAASAAPGIAEFKGRAESLDGGSEPVLEFSMATGTKIEPFYLADRSGRILIDPRGAKFRIGRASSYGGRLNEIVLKKRMTRPLLSRPLTTMLLPDDEFYVVGNVMHNPEAPPGASGADALVVKPLVEPGITNTFMSLLLGKTRIPAARDIQHVFFLSDGSEQEAKRHIMKGLVDIWSKALIVVFLCAVLITLQEPRAWGGRETWTLGEMLQTSVPGTEGVSYVVDALLRDRDDWPPVGWLRNAAYFSELLLIKDKIETIGAHNYLWNNVRSDAYRANAPDLARLYEKSSEPDMRRFAVWALGRVKAPPDLALPLLLRAVREQEPALRINALESLARVMPEAHPEVLKAQLAAAQDIDAGIARIALFSMRETRNLPVAEVLPVVSPLLSHGDGYVRHEAANVLARLKEGALPALGLLRAALHDPEYIVRNSAAAAVRNIGPAAAPAVPDLIALLKMSEHGNRQFAAEALGSIGPAARDALPELTTALEDRDQYVKKNAEYAIKKILGKAR